ncbi:TcpQ domain-containing protein [Acidovorax carolinensis]|nr:TcpQ domain-containing protein [Acidovorax carolinensis]
MRKKLLSVARAVVPIAGALAMISNAHAAYTVVEDDLYPTRVVAAPSETFHVAFNKGATALNPTARAFLSGLMPRLEGVAKIHIVGRIDSAVATESRKNEALAHARASTLRTYLIRAGVPASVIEIDTDLSANPLASTGVSPTDLIITNKNDLRAVQQARVQTSATHATPHEYRYLGQAGTSTEPRQTPTAPVAPVPVVATPKAGDQHLIAYINQAVLSGQMAPAVAVQLLRTLSETAAPPQSGAVAQSIAVAPPQAPARVERWLLNAQMTLKENMDQWAQASGWRPTVWDAANFYQVTSNATLDGAFPDVLKRVADSTGLNICVMTREKVVRVTDANVPCTK